MLLGPSGPLKILNRAFEIKPKLLQYFNFLWTFILCASLLTGCSGMSKATSSTSTNQPKWVYCQSQSGWISNCIYFIAEGDNLQQGRFRKLMGSDDGQEWYGEGSFETKGDQVWMHPYYLVRRMNGVVRDSSKVPSLMFARRGDSLFLVNDAGIVYVLRK